MSLAIEQKDIQTVIGILNRQGVAFLLETIAANTGNAAAKYRLTDSEKKNLVESLTDDLREALLRAV